MEQAGYISTSKMVTVLLWTGVAVLMTCSWILLFFGEQQRQVAYMLALTASTLSAVAAVANIRSYTTQVASLIRLTAGLVPDPEGPSLRRVN